MKAFTFLEATQLPFRYLLMDRYRFATPGSDCPAFMPCSAGRSLARVLVRNVRARGLAR